MLAPSIAAFVVVNADTTVFNVVYPFTTVSRPAATGRTVLRFSPKNSMPAPSALTPPFAAADATESRFLTVVTVSSGIMPLIPLSFNASVKSLICSVAASVTSFNGSSIFSYSSIPRDSAEPPNCSTAPFRLSCMVFAISSAEPSQFLYSLVSFCSSPEPRLISASIPERDSWPNRVISAWFFCSSDKPAVFPSSIAVMSVSDFIFPSAS